MLVGVLLFEPAAANATAASDPGCGATVTHSLVLHHDVLHCSGAGLIITADDVVLDLNGHTVSGTGTEGFAGVQVTSRRRVTIRGGTISGFDNGIYFINTNTSTVQSTRLVDNTAGALSVAGGTSNTLISNRIWQAPGSAAAGIVLFYSRANVVARNVLHGNSDGISLSHSNVNTISSNTSSHSGTGIGLFDYSHDNLVQFNVTDHNSDTGVLLDRQADHNKLIGNTARGNAFAGIVVGASDHNTVLNNITRGNLGSGIAIVDAAAYTAVRGNLADSNGHTPPGCVPDCPLLNDGIHVDAPLTYLNNNAADRNADLGIDAGAKVLGGRNNEAHANGDPRQCAGITCL